MMAQEQNTATPPDRDQIGATGIVCAAVRIEDGEWEPAQFKDPNTGRILDREGYRDLQINKSLMEWNTTQKPILGRDLLLIVQLTGTSRVVEAEIAKDKIPTMKKLKAWFLGASVKLGSAIHIIDEETAQGIGRVKDSLGIRGAKVALSKDEGGKYIVDTFLDGEADVVDMSGSQSGE